MKIHISLIILIICHITTFAQQKFGQIDVSVVISHMPEAKEAQIKIDELMQSNKVELQRQREAIEKKYSELELLDSSVPIHIRNLREEEIEAMLQTLKRFVAQSEYEEETLKESLMHPIIENVYSEVKRFGDEHGFTIILPLGLSLFIGDDVIDITDSILLQMGLK